ncbi:hypothetical protein [Paraburkholderia aromaticivorans]|uniref:hypothetical protein n=1 Tax=Paraburkholderia aromaticivorans TaxID=2026199 RepID=UPI001FCA3582|nr:hypothetical protein [Paraburkholderia aromaticivorans]
MPKAPSGQSRPRIEPSTLEHMLRSLPQLPPVVRYYDDFDDKLRSLSEVRQGDALGLHINGRLFRLDFSRYPPTYSALQKHLLVFLLGEDLRISTCFNVLNAAMHLDVHDVEHIVKAGPPGISAIWLALRARQLPVHAYRFVKAVLRLLCRHRLCGWSESYLTYVSTSLPGPATDKYARVRSGDVFLSADEEAAIVRYLDETSDLVRASGWSGLAYEALCDAAMVLCSYQFAMRPIQVAMLTMRDIRIWKPERDTEPTVHLTFLMVKQQGKLRKRPMVRRVKQEWGVLFIALVAYADSQGRNASDRVFGVSSNHEAGALHRLLGKRSQMTREPSCGASPISTRWCASTATGEGTRRTQHRSGAEHQVVRIAPPDKALPRLDFRRLPASGPGFYNFHVYRCKSNTRAGLLGFCKRFGACVMCVASTGGFRWRTTTTNLAVRRANRPTGNTTRIALLPTSGYSVRSPESGKCTPTRTPAGK